MEFTHFDSAGNAVMVDVTEKTETVREATAKGRIRVNREVFEAVKLGTVKKGDVLGVARVAGILGAKQTPHLIPMCHSILIEKCSIDFELLEASLEFEATCTVRLTGKTGVEMEALTGVSTALLTIYDMCKSIDKSMEIGQIYLHKKTGGKSGTILNARNAT